MSNFKKYGLTAKEYQAMKDLTGNTCYICSKPPKKRSLCIDHDHRIAKKEGIRKSVRGLLCFNCNRKVVGNLGDRPDCITIWQNTITYIENYRRLNV